MGYFNKIKFINFRNFDLYENEFIYGCNIIYGLNGSGKTNLLEGISLFGKGKGIRKDNIYNFIKLNKKKFVNCGLYSQENNSNEIIVESDTEQEITRKKISLNNDSSKESINYIYSLFSFVNFLPEMERLFLSSPRNRRNFIDNLIFSRKNNYNTLLNKYKKFIIERVKLLNSSIQDNVWLEKLEENITKLGLEIYDERQNQIQILDNNLKLLYKKKKHNYDLKIEICDDFYNSNIDFDSYFNTLKKFRMSDKLLGGSKIGPHKSDFMCSMPNGLKASQLSTGQQKTIVLLLILSQCNYLIEENKLSPVLLMDEVCSHLDENNREILLQLTRDFEIQIFMTGTDKNLFSFLSTNANFYNINN